MLGNNYFLATLSAMAENPERVKARFYTKEVNQAGIYHWNEEKFNFLYWQSYQTIYKSNQQSYYLMSFFINGKETPVYVDDYFPVSRINNQLCFAKCKGNLWVMLLEKAWAKILGTYARTTGG